MRQELAKNLEKLLETLRLDINHLYGEVVKGPLHRDRSSALVNYIKVLSSIQTDQKKAEEALEGASEEELLALAKAHINKAES